MPNPVWFAPNALWNAITGTPDNPRGEGIILCPNCFTAKVPALIAAAREEGRRERVAKHDADCRCGPNSGSHLDWAYHSTCTLRRIAKDQADQIASLLCEIEGLKAAHAAQLGALRDIVDCACNALTDSIRASGNDARTNMHWVDMLRRKALVPLPDAEAALEKVREEAVRDFLAKEPSGRYRAIPQRCGVWWTFGDDVVSEDVALTEAEARAVANALNALGGGA